MSTTHVQSLPNVRGRMLYGEGGNPFVKGEAVKFDCFPFGSTKSTLLELLWLKKFEPFE